MGARWWARAPGRPRRSCWPCSRRTGDAGPSSTTRWPASTRPGSASRSGCTGPGGRRARGALLRLWRRSSTARGPGGTRRAAPSRGPRRTPRALLREVRARERRRARRPRRRGPSGRRSSRRGGDAGARSGRRGCARRPRPRPPGSRSGSGRAAAASRRLRLEQLTFAQRVFGEAGEERPAGRPRGGAGPSRRALRCCSRSSAWASRDPALFAAAAGAARRACGVGAAGGGGCGPRGAAGGAGRRSTAPGSRARSTSRRPSAWCGRSSTCPWRGAGRARALAAWVEGVLLPELGARGLRRAAAGRAGDDGPARDGRRPGGGARGDSRRSSGRASGTGPIPGRAEFARLERVRARQGGASLADALRACRSAAPKKREPCAAALGEALVSLVYAAHLGRPRGPGPRRRGPLAAPRLRRASPGRCPRRSSGPGVPWHVRGSLLGLERALARLSLHGLAGDALPDAPARARRRAATGPRGPRGARQPPRADRRRPRRDRRRDRDRPVARGGPARGRRGRGGGVPRGRPRALAGAGLRVAARARTGRPRELLLARGAPPPRGARRAAVGRVGRRRRSRARASSRACRGPVPLDEASGRPPQPALAAGFVDLRPSRGGAPRRAAAAGAPLPRRRRRRSCRTSSPRRDPWRPTTGWASTRGCARRRRERLDDAVASLVGRGPLQPAAAPGEAR